jgi:uncharacterized protein
MNPKALFLPLVAVVAFLAIGCSGGTTYVQTEGGGSQSGINAQGTGSAVGQPDVMLLTVGVSAQRESIEAAREAAAAAQNGVIEALKSNGVAEKDIQTVQFNVSPQYDYSRLNGNGEIIGYVVSNVVNAKVRDLEKAGDAIDAVTAAGGDDAVVQGVSFGIDDPTELMKQAREEAVQKAKAQAEQLASNAGAKLGKLISISESSYYPYYDRAVPSAAGGVAFDESSTPIQGGELEISVTVNVLYAIE